MEERLQNTKDMTKGSPWKLMIIFAIPLLISNLFQQLYNISDSLIVGNFLGDNALAAVSSSGNIIFLFVSFFIGTGSGAGVIIAKYFGAKDYNNMSRAIHTNLAFGLISGILLTILGVVLSPYLLKLMNTPTEVLPTSITYFRFYFLGITGNILYNTCNGILQAIGNSKRPLYYLITSSILNIILDLLFVGVFNWGVKSAAIATSISQFTSCILCISFLMKKGTVYQVKFKKIRLHKDMLSLIFKYGIPAGVQNSVIAIANVFVQSNINTFGDKAMAGSGSYSKIEGLGFIPVNSFCLAISTYIGQNLGAKEYERAKKGARFGIICSMCLSEIIGIITFICIPTFIGMFSSDPEVISFGVKHARVMTLFYCLLAFSHSIASVCRGAGKAIVPMIVMLSVWCVFRVAYISVAMSISHNFYLLISAYPLTWFISSIIYIIYYKRCDWVHGFEKKQLSNKTNNVIE